MEHRRVPRAPAWDDVAVGMVVVMLAAVVGWQTTVIPSNAIYAQVGPKLIPWVATVMLAVLGILLVLQGLRGGWPHEKHGAFNPPGLAWFLLGLALNVTLISVAGFIIASTILFVCTAIAFG